MSILIDDSLEVGRFDVVHAGGSEPSPVDINFVLHVCCENEYAFARELVEKTVAMCGRESAHVRARVYVAEFNSALLYVSDAGLNKWRDALTDCPADVKAARQRIAEWALADYKRCVGEMAPRPEYCTHDVCFADGASVYYAGGNNSAM